MSFEKLFRVYNTLKDYWSSELVTPDWQNWNHWILEELHRPHHNVTNYLWCQTLANMTYNNPELVMGTVPEPLIALVNKLDMRDTVKKLLVPNDSGGATRTTFMGVETSSDIVFKVFQWLQFVDAVKLPKNKMQVITEFGGGYGTMAMVLLRYAPHVIYTIIDTPLMLAIAYEHLSAVFPENKLRVITKGMPFIQGVNFVPIGLMNVIENRADVFISLAALCEAPDLVVNMVANTRWFGAKYGLISFWQHELLEALINKDNVNTRYHPSETFQGHRYVNFICQTPRAKKVTGAEAEA
jgi:hypothetical protein